MKYVYTVVDISLNNEGNADVFTSMEKALAFARERLEFYIAEIGEGVIETDITSNHAELFIETDDDLADTPNLVINKTEIDPD